MFKDNNNPNKNINKLKNSIEDREAEIEKTYQEYKKINEQTDWSNMVMNQPITPTPKQYVNGNIWGKQPTSLIYNAEKIPSHDIVGINRIIKLEIIIEGEIIHFFKHFKLNQSVKRHHEFSLELAHDVLGEAENHKLENAQRFLGKRLTAIFRYSDIDYMDSPERVFVGVVTEVGFVQEQGSLGNILLTGYSPTILLDAAPHTQSFGGANTISLSSIAQEVIKQGISKDKFDYRIAAHYDGITYSAQYQETHYNYLLRMAEAYGEQFFYDGQVLHFGELPPQQKPLTLIYGNNINDVKVKMRAQHINPTFYGYNSSNDEKLTTGKSKIKHTSNIAQRAYSISEKTFTTPAQTSAPIRAHNYMDIDKSQKGTAGSKAVDVFVTSGTTTLPFMYPGCVADIEMREAKTGTFGEEINKTNYFTKLMITETTHEVDARGYYTGTFEAIAADTGYLPRAEFHMPHAEVQVAKVVSNSDPKNQGRVQVQFDWQPGQDRTEFIRVMTPDAGGSEKVTKNRGFMAIPEVGDQVMVGFQHQHPDRPFIMGAMFHGKVGGGGGQGNNVKSLSSKSGHVMELNDAAGITLRDKNGNHIIADGDETITGYANNEITFTNGKSFISMIDDTITIQAKNIILNGETIISQAKDIGISATNSIGIGVGSEDGDPTSGIGITSNNLDIGTTTLTMSSEAEANLGSKVINIGGGTETNIVSGTVKLN